MKESPSPNVKTETAVHSPVSFHTPFGMRPETGGISHGLRKCPPDTSLPYPSGKAALSIPRKSHTKKLPRKRGGAFFMVTRTGIEPMLPP